MNQIKPFEIAVNRDTPLHEVSSRLYGIFLEDINFACDGGLNANMVNNYSFDGVYLNREKKKEPVEQPDYLRFWECTNVDASSTAESTLSKNSRYAHLTVRGTGKMENLGYNGHKENALKCAMSIIEGQEYVFECYGRSIDFSGTMQVSVTDADGKMLTDTLPLDIPGEKWHQITYTLHGQTAGYGKLTITFDGNGSLDLDCVSLTSADYWNHEDHKWRHGKLRKDLVQALKDLKPTFVRFPGGCIVEGLAPGNEYDWKDTVGPLHERKHKYNMWGESIEGGSYTQSYQIGFYEYFCLCEDIDAKPLPTLFAGFNCQSPLNRLGRIETSSPQFKSYVIQNYLDLIEFANGNPDNSKWAGLRRDMGHPEPFSMDMVGIGNENFGKDYIEKFSMIKAAIHEKYPDILCVMSNGLYPHKPFLKRIWKYARNLGEELLVDEHSYHSPKWYYKASRRFDDYTRGKAGVYFGEYAANGLMALKPPTENTSNYFASALAEAAFLTGVERNSDIVKMTSYAPLLCLVGSKQWLHNMIDFNPAHLCLTTNYMVQKLFSSHVGNQYLPHQGDLPKKVYFSATCDENRIYIKLVNAGEEDIQVCLKVQGESFVSAQWKTLQSERLDIKNKLEYEGGPKYNLQPTTAVIQEEDGTFSLHLRKHSVNIFIA